MTPETRVRIAPSLAWLTLTSGGVVLDLTNGRSHQLNELGGFVWARIGEGASLERLLEAILETYEVGREDAWQDLHALVAELRMAGLLLAEDDVTPEVRPSEPRELLVVGIGTGPVGQLTREAEEQLLAADRVFVRYRGHPVVRWLLEQGRTVVSFDSLYGLSGLSYSSIYAFIRNALLLHLRRHGRTVFAQPGSPYVFEETTRSLAAETLARGLGFRTIAGVSFLELVCQQLGLDPGEGMQILNGKQLESWAEDPKRAPLRPGLGLLVGQFAAPVAGPTSGASNAVALAGLLAAHYPPDHEVCVVWDGGPPEHETRKRCIKLRDLGSAFGEPVLATLWVPPLEE